MKSIHWIGATPLAGRVALAFIHLAATASLLIAAPEPVSPPSISGTALPGHTLAGTTGTWSENPASYTYQWWKDGAAIPGAASAEYTVPFTAAPGSGFQLLVTASATTGTGTALSDEVLVSAYDENAADWFERVETAGSSFDLSASHPAYDEVYTKAIWNELVLDLKAAGIWSAIGDLSAFCGIRDLAGTTVKIKGTGANLIQNLTAANYVAAGASAGLQGNGTNGYIDPQRTIASAGISANNGHAFVYVSSDTYSSAGAVLSDQPATGSPRLSMYNTSGLLAQVAGSTTKSSPSGEGFFGLTLDAGGYKNHGNGIYRTLPVTGVTLTTSNPINFLRRRVSGNYQYSSHRIALASMGSSLDDTACWEFHRAVEKVMSRLGVIPDLPKVVFFGDSGVEGVGSSGPTKRYTRIVAEALGMREINLGISSSCLTRDRGTVPAGYYRVNEVLKQDPDLVFIPYGANDANDWYNSGSPTLEQFTAAYSELIDDLVAGGIAPGKIVVTGLSWNMIIALNPSAEPMMLQWNQNLANIAAAKGVLYIDLYPSSKQGGAAEMADSLHANDAGMARRADTIVTALETSLSELWLSEGALSPVFSGSVTTYNTTVPQATGSITLMPVAANSQSLVSVNGTQVSSPSSGIQVGLQRGTNLVTTVVTSADGSTSRSYTVTVVRGAALTQPSWRQEFFGTPEDSGNAADLTDFDKDGIVNLMEFACGLDPTSKEASPLAIAASGSFLEFNYPRSLDAVSDGVSFAVEWCDLFPMEWSTEGVTEAVQTETDGIEQVRAYVPLNGTHKFARLRIRKP